MDARSFAQFMNAKLSEIINKYVNVLAFSNNDDQGFTARNKGSLSAVKNIQDDLGNYLKEFEDRFMNPPVAPNSEDDAK